MKRVKQISLDILVGPEADGQALAQEVEDELKMHGFTILGAMFQYDLTDEYKEHFPKMLKEE